MSTMGSSESKDSRPKPSADYIAGGSSNSQPQQGQADQRSVAGGSVAGSQYNHSQIGTESVYSLGSTGGWIAEADARIIASGLIPSGYSTAPNVPAGELTKGCEPCVNPPQGPTGMKLFQAMRKEWTTKTVNPPPAPTIDDVDPDDIADAIEDTPGDFLEPAVHLPVMLDILIDIWEDSGLYD